MSNGLDRAALMKVFRANLRPYWNSSEAGGIFVVGVPYDQEANLAAWARLFPFFPEIDIASRSKWWELVKSLVPAVDEFLKNARLSPGEYQLANYHYSYARDEDIRINMWGDDRVIFSSEDPFTFTVTWEHISLIRHMNCREYANDLYLMDAKRPYGDMSYFYIDMADALGEPVPRDEDDDIAFPPEVQARYRRLHGGMLFAVQAFLERARYP
jgi:hypothetical protein